MIANLNHAAAERPVDGIQPTPPVRPGRTRITPPAKRKDKKPGDAAQPHARKAPARGRYVDEYARAAFWGGRLLSAAATGTGRRRACP